MGLKITRSKGDGGKPFTDANSSNSSAASARDLFLADNLALAEPTFVEQVVPDVNGHLGPADVKQLFDRLWRKLRAREKVIVQLDMADVKTADNRFTRELEFFRRQIRRQHGEIRVANYD